MMKKMFLSMALLATAFCFAEETITIHDMTDISQFEKILSNENEEIIFAFPKGMKMPFTFNIDGDVIHLATKENTPFILTFQQETYMKFTEEEVFMSLDRENWKPTHDFFTGEFSVRVMSKEGEPALAEFNLLMNAKK